MPPTITHATPRVRAEIKLRKDGLDEAMAAAEIPTISALAVAMGVDRSNLHKVLRGAVRPGEEFIAAVLAAFPKSKFEDLFEVLEPAA